MRNWILLLITVALAACASPPTPGSKPTPVAETPSVRERAEAFAGEVVAWKTPEEAWARVHPECVKLLEGDKRALVEKDIDFWIHFKGHKEAKLMEYQEQPSAWKTYPVKPDFVLVYEKVPVWPIVEQDGQWFVSLGIPTEAALQAEREVKLSEPEAQAVAKKALGEMSPELRQELDTLLKEEKLIAAIKRFREVHPHSLRVCKLVIDQLR